MILGLQRGFADRLALTLIGAIVPRLKLITMQQDNQRVLVRHCAPPVQNLTAIHEDF